MQMSHKVLLGCRSCFLTLSLSLSLITGGTNQHSICGLPRQSSRYPRISGSAGYELCCLNRSKQKGNRSCSQTVPAGRDRNFVQTRDSDSDDAMAMRGVQNRYNRQIRSPAHADSLFLVLILMEYSSLHHDVGGALL